jgi:DNA mismatch repair ATPase MutS
MSLICPRLFCAYFRIAEQIFTRIGVDDNFKTNSSTFMVEMKVVHFQYILAFLMQ